MQAPRICVMLSMMLFAATVLRADKVRSDFDHSVNFSQFRTFKWIRQPVTNEPFAAERIMKAVNLQLTARGLREVTEGARADLAIGANLASEEKHTWETYYSGSGWDWGPGWTTTVEKTYEVGTLTVDVFDADNKKIVWQGISVDTIPSKAEKRIKDRDKQIEKMFRGFPPIIRESD
jgi:Domain of unknown function (DUF4136)